MISCKAYNGFWLNSDDIGDNRRQRYKDVTERAFVQMNMDMEGLSFTFNVEVCWWVKELVKNLA